MGFRQDAEAMRARIQALESALAEAEDKLERAHDEAGEAARLREEVARLRRELDRTSEPAPSAQVSSSSGSSPRGTSKLGALIDGLFTEPGDEVKPRSWPLRIFMLSIAGVALVPIVVLFVPSDRLRVAEVESVSGDAPLSVGQQCEFEATCRQMVGDSELQVRCPGVSLPAAMPASCSFVEDTLETVRVRDNDYEITLDLQRSRARLVNRQPNWSAQFVTRRVD